MPQVCTFFFLKILTPIFTHLIVLGHNKIYKLVSNEQHFVVSIDNCACDINSVLLIYYKFGNKIGPITYNYIKWMDDFLPWVSTLKRECIPETLLKSPLEFLSIWGIFIFECTHPRATAKILGKMEKKVFLAACAKPWTECLFFPSLLVACGGWPFFLLCLFLCLSIHQKKKKR